MKERYLPQVPFDADRRAQSAKGRSINSMIASLSRRSERGQHPSGPPISRRSTDRPILSEGIDPGATPGGNIIKEMATSRTCRPNFIRGKVPAVF